MSKDVNYVIVTLYYYEKCCRDDTIAPRLDVLRSLVKK